MFIVKRLIGLAQVRGWHTAPCYIFSIVVFLLMLGCNTSTENTTGAPPSAMEADSIRLSGLISSATGLLGSNLDSAFILSRYAIEETTRDGRFKTLVPGAWVSMGEAYDVAGNLDSALYCFDKALDDFKRLGYLRGQARVFNSRGLAYHYNLGTKLATEDFNSALAIARQINDKVSEAKYLHNLGMTFVRQIQYYEGLDAYLEARNLKDSLLNAGVDGLENDDQATTLNNLGALYQTLKQWDFAKQNYLKASELIKDEANSRALTVWYNLGTIAEEQGEYKQAEQWLQKSLEIAKESNLAIQMPNIYNALGNVSHRQGNMEAAGNFYQTALDSARSTNNLGAEIEILIDEAEYFIAQNNLINARGNLTNALAMAEANTQAGFQLEAHKFLAIVAQKTGDVAEEVRHQRSYIAARDTLESQERKLELVGLQAVKDVELADAAHQRALLAQENEISQRYIRRLTNAFIAICILALSLAFAVYVILKRNRSLRELNERLAQFNVQLAASNQQLNLANNKLQQFAFATGHDLKESLRNITSFTQLAVIEMGQNNGSAATHLNEASAAGKRMRKMLDDLLHYSNIGGNDTVIASVPLEEIVSAVKKQLESDILEKRADVQLATPATFKVNRMEMEQLFYNLIHNALKYSKNNEPPRIRVSIARRGDIDVFEVKDNGMGIPTADRELIFKPFHRLLNRQHSGSGLGLSISQKIVENYGGKIWYEPANDGSVFCFTLPSASLQYRQLA